MLSHSLYGNFAVTTHGELLKISDMLPVFLQLTRALRLNNPLSNIGVSACSILLKPICNMQ